ncbi:hypothetical protein QFC22_001393 [Naganishia vaughanmartiniae]|uniref:Uncharacterized protein n=1 Tax=Naganishia vaughanmartiniae TaxID=1424756 RepID=A0ACC2XHY1_9TREE|nr:hypothetical protein QFC22_001393 [Naganishia vaughanmartiniae]
MSQSTTVAQQATTSEIPATTSAPRELAQTSQGRTSGKPWKLAKTATKRSHLMPGVKAASWDQRQARRAARENMKKLETQLRDEKKAEEDAKVQSIKERRLRKEENVRLEEMKAKMSAKKLQRMKKRLGRTKNKTG